MDTLLKGKRVGKERRRSGKREAHASFNGKFPTHA
jgi:hypothetical protein